MDYLWISLIQQTGQKLPQSTIDVFTMIGEAGFVVKVVILILILMSIASWGIIFSKLLSIRSASKNSSNFLDRYHSSNDFRSLYHSVSSSDGPVAEVFRAGYKEVVETKSKKRKGAKTGKEKKGSDFPEGVSPELEVVDLVERALKKAMTTEVSRLESSLIFLATIGNTAPFIGLFGTVWGIMTSFIGLAGSNGVPSLQVVAPGIAEALIATAIGLGAAIPAVVGYNYFVSKVKKVDIEMENFSAEFLNIVEKYI